MKINESYLARRRFLCGMLGGGAAALGAGVSAPLVGYVGNLREEPPPDWLEIEEADYRLAPGESKTLFYGRIPALLFKTPDAAPESLPRVFVATCTHLDCTVTYDGARNDIVCHCHEGRYDIDGNVISRPPPRPLPKFFTRIRSNGNLVIALEQENLEKAFQDT
jgi:cytochrome b6-f complex iron-sulfur subunit